MTRDLLLVSISLFTWGVGEGMYFYFQPLYLEKLGATPFIIGAILSANGIAMTLAQIPGGYLADRYGPRPLMWAAWIMGAISTTIMAFSGSLPMFVAGYLLYGLTSSVLAPMNSYITRVRGTWPVQRALTFPSAMFHLGAVIGPIIGGWVGEQYSFSMVYKISAGIFFLSSAVILCIRPVQPTPNTQVVKNGSLLQNRAFLVMLGLVFASMTVLYLPLSLTPNFLQNQIGLDLRAIGYLGSVGSLGNAVFALVLGSLHPSTGFIIGQTFVALAALLFRVGKVIPAFAGGYFFFGGYRLSRSMVLALTRDLVHPSEIGLAYGFIETANALSVILAPFLAGILYEWNPVAMYSYGLLAITAVLLVSVLSVPRLLHSHAARQRNGLSLEEESHAH